MSGADMIKSFMCGVETGLALRRFVNLQPLAGDTAVGELIYPTADGECNIGVTVGDTSANPTQHQSVQILGEVEVEAGEAIPIGSPIIGKTLTGLCTIPAAGEYAIGFALEEATADGDHILVALVGPWLIPLL